MRPKRITAMLAIACPCLAAGAQPFVIDSYTIDGGGGTSTGGTFELSGTIGQHDAGGLLAGSAYEVTSGFWAQSGSGSCNVADFAAPYGTLDFTDIIAFLTAFGAMDPQADLAAPTGIFDFTDVIAFLTAFGAGCP
jgi:hypothetical protein